ncbi:MAG: class I SAM-dependent methyltransferase [Actinomycetota bacterium]|nr:class I SAM-dependent methyltransferase [Actinomycetota bacterium]
MKEKLWDDDDAAHYEDPVPSQSQLDAIRAIVDVLVELAGEGPALEFAIGTGRIGLRLAARGVCVVGLENSTAMAGRLREKDPDERVPLTIGDMATERVAGSFQLVYLVFNTIGNLTTQDRQVACFANAAAHLRPGGFFLIENTVPDLRRLPPGEDARVFAHAPGYIGYDRYTDLVAQYAVSHHFVARGNAVRESMTPWRFVWPSELDLMAQLAGMELHFRWADWDHSPFTGDSTKHVSVWRKVSDPHADDAHGPATRSTATVAAQRSGGAGG